MNERKFILKSKTFWLNTLSIVGVIVGVLPITPYTVAGGAIVNLILRTVTDKGVTLENKNDTDRPLIKDED